MNIGIDLGTTNTLACYVNNAGMITKIEFKNGRNENKFLLPSCVSVTESGEILTGQPALERKFSDPETVLENTKYFMGTDKTWTVGRISLTAEKTAEYILREVYRELSEQFPDEKIFNAFVTVPARFDSQIPRIATKNALRNAGFEVNEKNSVTDEPISAAIAYSQYLGGGDTLLVVDIGGGTFDLSLIASKITGNSASADRLVPIGWDGDLYLGGNNFDEILLELMCGQIIEETGINLSAPPDDMNYSSEQSEAAATLRTYIEPLKKQIYSDNDEDAEIYIDELMPDYDFYFTISRKDYENAVRELAVRMKSIIERLYKKTDIPMQDTDKILVVGGMAHEYCLVKILEEFFGKEKILIPDDSMYLVARGASICNSNAQIHVDNTAYTSIGVLIKNRSDVDIIIREGDIIDENFSAEREYSTVDKNAWEINITVVEFKGEFSVSSYTTLMSRVISLKRGFFQRNRTLKFNFTFTEDKILKIIVTQQDGTQTPLDVRL
ncbi:MAG: Hsp70 family protein [Ruminococcus sp.]|nr:Hsp70 family protein [Ruminococcus sp.]